MTRRLPTYPMTTTEDPETYCKEWANLSFKLQRIFPKEYKVSAFDPGFRMSNGSNSFDLPIDVVLHLTKNVLE